MTCCFFGHRDCPDITDVLTPVLVKLIEDENADTFYVGSHGNFDRLVLRALRRLKERFAHISFCVVLAYMPQESRADAETICPEGIEAVPKRYAISWRNNWMLKHSDIVITYITRSYGGAAQFAGRAERQNKKVVNLAELTVCKTE